MRTPKFRKQHKAFPLTRFLAHLRAEEGARLSASTAQAYVSAIRRMLAAVGTSAENREAWRDTDAVDAYFGSLPRNHVVTLQAAFTHWLAFNDVIGVENLSIRAQRASLSNAINLFLKASRGRSFVSLREIPFLMWTLMEDHWALKHTDKQWSHGPRFIPHELRPAAELIRTWGKGKDGTPFLPEQPGSNVPMTYARICTLTDNKTPENIARSLQNATNAELVRARTAHLSSPPSTIEIEAGTKIVDGELVVDRTNLDVKTYEDFKLPDE